MFKNAIEEIEREIQENNFFTQKITLKEVPTDDLLATFNNSKMTLQNLFNQRRVKLDRFNYGIEEYDFLTVLERIVGEEQKTKMFQQICTAFTGNFGRYIQNPMVSEKIVLVHTIQLGTIFVN